jgi:hypothetical protein
MRAIRDRDSTVAKLANGINGVDLGVSDLPPEGGLIKQAVDDERIAQFQAAGYTVRRGNGGGYFVQKGNASPLYLRNLETLKAFRGVKER